MKNRTFRWYVDKRTGGSVRYRKGWLELDKGRRAQWFRVKEERALWWVHRYDEKGWLPLGRWSTKQEAIDRMFRAGLNNFHYEWGDRLWKEWENAGFNPRYLPG